MKKYILLFLFVQNIVVAQKRYTNEINHFVKESIEKIQVNDKKNLDELNNIYNGFLKGTKPELALVNDKLMGLSISNKDLVIYPSRYAYEKEEIALRSYNKEDKSLITEYIKTYTSDFKNLNKNAIYKKHFDGFLFGKASFITSDKEIILKSGFNTYFLRTYKEKIFAIGINKNYNAWKNKPVLFFTFNLVKKSNKQLKAKPTTVTTTTKPSANKKYTIPDRGYGEERLFHDYFTDEIREGMKLIHEIEPQSDEFVKNAKALNEKLSRENITKFTPQLEFFKNYNLKLPKDSLKGRFYLMKQKIYNINHVSAHALGDIYMGKKQYKKAIENYKLALVKDYYTNSGTSHAKCNERILYDIADAYFLLDKPESAVLYLLDIVSRNYILKEAAEKILIEYAKATDYKQFKKTLIMAIDSVKFNNNGTYKITYGNTTKTFKTYYDKKTSIQYYMVKCKPYKMFDYK